MKMNLKLKVNESEACERMDRLLKDISLQFPPVQNVINETLEAEERSGRLRKCSNRSAGWA